jgi:dihydrofolate reductase
MGRKTYASVGCLPGRGLVVISRSAVVANGCAFDVSPEHLVEHVRTLVGGGHRLWLCGGAQTYREFLPWCEELYVTLVRQVVDGDAFFPPVGAREFRVQEVVRDTSAFQMVRMRNSALFSDGLRD